MTSDLPVGYYLCDYHIHTSQSFDASGTIEDACRAAVERGMNEIGFCEHVGIDKSDDAYGTLDYDGYVHSVEQARKRYSGRLKVRLGVEIDFRSSVIKETSQFLESREFDYVVGGLHYLDGQILLRTNIFERHNHEEVWEHYFSELLKMVKTGFFDIIAHLDVPKRGYVPLHGPFDWLHYEGRIREILSEIISRGAALEINTAGLRKQADELFPGPGILSLYRRLGGELVSFGSDAHSPQKVGCDFTEALAAAAAAGFTHVATYEARRLKRVPLKYG